MKAGTLEIEIVAEIARLQQDLAEVKRAVKGVDDAIRPANDNFNKFGKGAQQAGASSKLASHQVQNLAYQFNDLFVSLASGQKPMTVFMQQGSQIGQIMAQARIGVGGLTKEIGGMIGGFARAHPVMTAIAVATAAAAVSVSAFAKQTNSERKAELDAYAASLGLANKELEKLGPISISATTYLQALHNTVAKATGLDKIYRALGNTISVVFSGALVAAKNTAAAIYAFFAGGVDNIKVTWSRLPAILGEAAVGAANAAIRAIEGMINKGIDGLNTLATTVNQILGTTIGKIGHIDIPELKNQFSGAGRAAADAYVSNYQARFNQAKSGMSAFGKEVADEAVRLTKEQYRAAAEEKGFLDPDDARKAGGKAGKAAGEKFMEEFLKALKEGYYQGIADLMDGNKSFVKDWEKDVTTAWKNLGDTFKENAKVATDYTTDWNAELRKTVDLLDSMGAGKLGNIGAALAGLGDGDFSGVRGKGGALLQMLSATTWKNGQGQTVSLREELVKGLDKVFGKGGSFAETMNELLQGAGLGAAIGGVFFAGNSAAQTGSTIGGAFGKAAFKEFASDGLKKTLGEFGGPLGSLLGSVVGGLLGSLFSSVKKGVATFSGSGLVSTSGNSKSRIAAATSTGNSALDALAQIADAFGADIGDASFSLGVRKKNYVLDPTGQGRTKGAGVLNFGQDSEAAIKAAIKDAISDGVFEGLSAGVERLLKGEGDIEKQLKKALDFQGVFDELSQRTDPTGFGLGQLDKQFGKLRDIFAEAGASTEEYAKLEELFQLKRTEIINEGSRRARELEIEIMRLTGDEIGALAAERAMEKEGLDATLSALIDRRNALIDEAIAAEQARAAADERRQLEYRMAQVLGDEEKILTMRREDELAAVSDLNKVYLQQVHAAEAAAAAVAKAAAAQNAAVSSLQGLPGMIGGGVLGAAGNPAVMSALGMFAGGDVTGARNALASYISNTVGTALPGATSAVQSAAIDQVIASLSPSGPVNIGRGVTTGQLGGNKKPAGNLSDGKLAQSFADAEAARVDKLDDLHSRLADAYDREKKALEDLIEPLKKIREQFAEFRDELDGKLGGRDSFAALQGKFLKTSALAATGDMDAMGALVGVSKDYLGAAKDRTGSLVAYQRFVATVRAAVNQADLAASEQIDYNEEQLKALDRQVEGQIETNKKLDTIADLLAQLNDETGGMRSEQRQLGTITAVATKKTHRTLDRTTRGGTALNTETVF